MKVIFLDFDGVLNTDRYVKRAGHFGVVIDPERMVFLRRIVDMTGAKIVLSTSWREHWENDAAALNETGREINRIFAENSLYVWDKTPRCSINREDEIKAWLDNAENIESFVVIDDMFLAADFLEGHFVRTSQFRDGLNEEDVQRAICILNGEEQ